MITTRSDMPVTLVDHMGSDDSIIKAMLVSTLGIGASESEASAGRINYLMKNRHGTPFEHASMTFMVEAPIFVFREFHRHRIGWSYNEMSGRYRELDAVFYIPAPERPLQQIGKPGHYEFVPGTAAHTRYTVNALTESYRSAYGIYKELLQTGIAKEVARACLPVGIYSAMYATCNPRSLMSFLSLRTKDASSMFPSYPQYEIEVVAKQMEAAFATAFPLTHESFIKNGRVAP